MTSESSQKLASLGLTGAALAALVTLYGCHSAVKSATQLPVPPDAPTRAVHTPSSVNATAPPVDGWLPSTVGLVFRDKTLFPETVVFDETHQRLLAGSVRHGGVFVIEENGSSFPLVDDPRLCSVLGVAVDTERGRLIALNSELGVGERRCGDSPRGAAGVGVYDLQSGKALHYVDLDTVAPGGKHFANGVALDAAGNAYVSDSFASRIYKVEPSGAASVWLEDAAAFGGSGIGLNGLVAHPQGYLLAVKKDDGSLFRIPLDEPSRWQKVRLSSPMVGGDGVLLTPQGRLVCVANQVAGTTTNAAFMLSSTDDWASATVGPALPLGEVYPTVPVAIGAKLFFLHTHLNHLLSAKGNAAQLSRTARLDYLGEVDRPWREQAFADSEATAFVLAELQPMPEGPLTSWDELSSALVARPGLLNLTWLGDRTERPSAFIAFDTLAHAHAFANDFFPRYAMQVGVGQSTKLFNAQITREASQEMGSVHFGATLAVAPKAFVYTEVQVDVPFTQVPWRERNPAIRANSGFLAKTWLSGINTRTVGGLYAFATLEDARHFALEFFPRGAARQGAAFTALVYPASPGAQASRRFRSPFFRERYSDDVRSD